MQSFRMRNLMLTSTVLSWGLLVGAPVHAQQASADAATGIQDIVVTARKTNENLQTTPVAVTALTTADIKAAQITSVSDLQKKAPTLTLGQGGPGGPGAVFLGMRGQTNTGGNSTSDSPIATYQDGVYFARSTAGNLGVYDVSQVEVLRGPQGTLFGRNTTGGALNISTVQPDGKEGGYGYAEFGNYGSKLFEGGATIPIMGEELSLRVAGRYASHDGYYDNPISNLKFNDLDHFYALRGTLKWAPADKPFDLTVTADTADWADNGQATSLVAFNPAIPTAIFTGLGLPAPVVAGTVGLMGSALVGSGGPGKYDETYGVYGAGYVALDTPYDDGKSGGVQATLNVDFGSWKLKSISAWRKADSNNSLDLDGTPITLVTFGSAYRQDQYSQELQASTTIGNLDLIGGLLYFKEEGFEQSISTQGPFLGTDIGEFSAESKAVFAQGNYSFTDKLRVTAGLRYTWDSRDLTRQGRSNLFVPTSCTSPIPLTASGCSLPLTADFDYPAWLLSVDYKLNENVFLYAKTSRASLSGGFNTREAPLGNESFEPEEATDFEVGAKVDLFDRRLRANVAVYTMETTGAQRQAAGLRANGSTTQFTQNTGDVDVNGAEFEVTAAPWEGMTVNLGAAYTDASYAEGSFLETRAAGVVVDRSGEPVPQAPEWSFNAGATQKVNFEAGVLTLHADYTYFDDKVANTFNTLAPGASAAQIAANNIANQAGITPSYSLVNGRLAFQMNNGLELSVWGKNILDEEYYTYAFAGIYSVLGVATQNQGTPATYGVGLRYDF